MVTPTLLQVTGSDATAFLHSQLSVDIQRLAVDRHVLGAWCDAKGRTLCTPRVIATADGFLLLLPADLASTVTRRLRMYVLRADVTITDVSTAWTLRGQPAPGTHGPGDGVVTRRDDSLQLGIGSGLGPGVLTLQRNAAPAPATACDTAWQLAEIDAGLPEITAATSARFVPQMLNLHWLGGIAFDKGCYPGQEIVARLQYRGRLKQRLFRLQWQGRQPQAGDAITDSSGKKQGTVIRSATVAENAGRLLAVIRVDADRQTLTSQHSRLELLDLPYPTDAAQTDSSRPASR